MDFMLGDVASEVEKATSGKQKPFRNHNLQGARPCCLLAPERYSEQVTSENTNAASVPDDLAAWLMELKLESHGPKLVMDHKVAFLLDVRFVEENDLLHIGMGKVEARRFIAAAAKLGVNQPDLQVMKVAGNKRTEAAGSGAASVEVPLAIPQPHEMANRANQAVEAAETLRKALVTRDYDKISDAVEAAEALDICIAELDQARAVLKTLEATPLPAAVATGTMLQILDISRSARFRFEKFDNMRPQERYATGRLMLASSKKKAQDGCRFMHTKEVIPCSMLDLETALGKQAISCHKCLLGFCGDRKIRYPTAAGHHVLLTGAQSVELRDEIFVQLCKHLTQNPDACSTLRGWILMCLCVDLFLPSVNFQLYLFNFLGSALNDAAYGGYARYNLARLEEALELVCTGSALQQFRCAAAVCADHLPCPASANVKDAGELEWLGA